MVRFSGFVAALLSLTPVTFAADIFDRQPAATVKKFIDQGEVVAKIGLETSAKLKPLSTTISSPCILVKTDEGNYAKALVSWGLRKSAGKPTPILLIERFVTYRQDRLDLTAASGKDVMLFPGFGFNFDIGQVVPKGQGADIEFTEDSELKSVGDARIVPLGGNQLPPVDPVKKHDPAAHEGVVPDDFTSTWKVNADGRWLGEWRLNVSDGGHAKGVFVSDESRNTYDISGQIGGAPNNLKLDVFLANTQMAVDAYLWTKDKSMMAGTVTLSGRKFGFVATRIADEP